MNEETNQPLVSNTTNLPNESLGEKTLGLQLESLTDQNWLFIKYYLETADIRKAYSLAGYEGTAASNPYNVFKRLKPFIEEIGNLAVTSRLKLVADLSKVLSIPLVNKESLTVSEWLRVRKFAATLTPEVSSDKPKLSVLIINRSGPIVDNGTRPMDSNTTQQSNPKEVIDIQELKPEA